MAPPRKPRSPCRRCGSPVNRVANTYCSRTCFYSDASDYPNSGTFTPGQTAHNLQPVGATVIRSRPERDEGPRVFVKVAEPDVWQPRSRVVWEENFGPLPDDLVVHHINRDTMDDSLSNLEALTRAEHLLEHRDEYEPVRLDRLRGALRK